MGYTEKAFSKFQEPLSFKTVPFPICAPNQPIMLRIYFWVSVAFTTYLLVVEMFYLYNYPEYMYGISGIIVSQVGALSSICFIYFYRKEARNLFYDACVRLHRCNPALLKNVNFRFKTLFCFYFVYVNIVLTLQLVTDPVIMDGPTNTTGYAKFLSFDYNIVAPDWVQTASAWGLILGQNLFLFLLSGYLVMLVSYLSVVIGSVGEYAIHILNDKGFHQHADEINYYFLVFVNLVNRLSVLLNNLLMVWFTVTLYASCNNAIKYISERNGCNSKYLNFKLPSLFHDMLNLAILTFLASNLPAVTTRALSLLISKSEGVLSLNKSKEYLFLRQQFKSGPYGLKIGGMFIITTRLYISYMGLGITYAIIYIQLNPALLRKLQGETN